MRTEAESLWWWTLLSLRSFFCGYCCHQWLVEAWSLKVEAKDMSEQKGHKCDIYGVHCHLDWRVQYGKTFPLHFSPIWPFKESKSCIKVWSTLLTPQQHKSTTQQWPGAMYSTADPPHYNPLQVIWIEKFWWSFCDMRSCVEFALFPMSAWVPSSYSSQFGELVNLEGGRGERKVQKTSLSSERRRAEHRGQKVKRRVRVKLSRWNHKIPRLSLWSLQLKRSVWSYSLSQWPSVSVGAHIQKPLLVF